MSPNDALDFVDAQNGWVVSGLSANSQLDGNLAAAPVDGGYRSPGTGVMLTTDGGATWQNGLPSDDTKYGVWGVDRLDASTGWVVAVNALYGTSDDGASWGTLSEPTDLPLVAVDFSDATSGYGITSDGALYRSSDGGGSWQATALSVPAEAVCSQGGGTIVLGQSGDLYTVDAKGTPTRTYISEAQSQAPVWGQLDCQGSAAWAALQYSNASSHVPAGEAYQLLASTDGGSSWSPVTGRYVDLSGNVKQVGDPLDGVAVTALTHVNAEEAAPPSLVGYTTGKWAIDLRDVTNPTTASAPAVTDLSLDPQNPYAASEGFTYAQVHGATTAGGLTWLLVVDLAAVNDAGQNTPTTYLLHSTPNGPWVITPLPDAAKATQ